MDPHGGGDRRRLRARRRPRAVRIWPALLLACVALLLAGCGSSTLSAGQLHHRATRICTSAQQRSESIPAPDEPEKAAQFLRQGVAALAPPLAALHKLKAPDDLADDYDAALRASDRELSLLRSTLHALDRGEDPVMAIRALQRKLDPDEDAAAGAWRAVGVHACTTLMG
jgi:hypothetical protein